MPGCGAPESEHPLAAKRPDEGAWVPKNPAIRPGEPAGSRALDDIDEVDDPYDRAEREILLIGDANAPRETARPARIRPHRGVNSEGATVRRGPRPVFDVFPGSEDRPSPRLPYGEDSHGVRFSGRSSRHPDAGPSRISRTPGRSSSCVPSRSGWNSGSSTRRPSRGPI